MSALRQHLLHNIPSDAREAHVEALKLHGQTFVINAEQVEHRLVALSCRELAVCQGNRLHMNAAATARARGSRSASSPDVVLAELGETAWGKRPPGQSFPTAAVRPSTDRTTNDRFVPDGAA